MPRHYLKISKRLRPYAAKVATLDENWRQMIFNDLTHLGRELRIVHVAPNEQGPLIGLCGQKFFCHAGQDKHNAYSLFISRITPSAYRPGSEAPTRIVGEYELITESDWDPPPMDPVKPLFQQAQATSSSDNGRAVLTAPDSEAHSAPSETLLLVLEDGGSALRHMWTPAAGALVSGGSEQPGDRSPSTNEILDSLKELWTRFRLEEYAELDPRPLALLKGTIMPGQVSEADCADVSVAFGIDSLNAMVKPLESPDSGVSESVAAATRTAVLDLVRELSHIPLDPAVRSDLHDAVMHATSRSLVHGKGRQVVHTWIMRQCGVTHGTFTRQRQDMHDFVRDWLASAPADNDSLLAFTRRLRRLQERVAESQTALPDEDALEARKREAERAYVRAMDLLGDLTVPLLEHAPELSADSLLDIAALCAQESRLAALPTWLWSTSVSFESQAASSRRMVWCQRLTDNAQRARIKRACQLLEGFDPGLHDLLSQYPGPPAETTAEAHFLRAVEQLAPLANDLGGLPKPHLRWVRHALDESWPAERILGVVKVLDDLRERLTATAADEMIADLEQVVTHERTPTAAEARVIEYGAAIEQIEALFGTAQDASFAQIERLLGRRDREARAASAPSKPSTSGPLLRFDHNWVDETGRRVPLYLVPYEDRERPYGVIRVPLVVRTPAPRDVSCELEVEVSSSLQKNWPDGWDRPTPRSLRIQADSWRERGDEAAYTFPLTVPLRLPKSGKESVDIAVRALDSKSGWPISERKRLRWSRISVWQGEIPFSWPDTVQPEFVRAHPIGPQRRFEDIVHRLGKGGSFAVVAPRRFGKTTLVEYLHAQAREHGLAMPAPIVCTSVVGEYGLDYRALWRQVSSGFVELLGVGLEEPDASGHGDSALAALPPANSFDAVREKARDLGLSAVVVLLDEAQLLFPQSGGNRLGNAFKDRLERSWSRGDLPPVAIGFIGLPGLRERAGANLMGILRPYEGRQVEERSLNRLILQVTRERLSTTREARQRLAAQAGNLYMLKTLLDRLVGHINQERRTWAAFQDVRRVEAELRQELEQGEGGHLDQYMRDPLNRSEDINEWEPRACYPVALAVAVAATEAPEASVTEQLEAAAQLCDRWCRRAGQETGHTLTFPKKRMEEHMATLRELGLWDGTRFISDLVRAWLVGVARRFPKSDTDRRVLVRAALPRIRIPAEREHVAGSDREAHVYRFLRDGVAHALIQVPVLGQANRQRFVERVDALQIVKERRRRGEPGSQYLCPIVDAGLAEGIELGVTTHRWIDGQTLARARGQLDSILIVELGTRLATALQLLHDHDVVHEHVIPEHIVVERVTARPMLIDFGLSRIALAAGPSKRSHDLLTKTADIAALGATLADTWHREGAGDDERAVLDPLLAACRHKRAKERPDATGVLRLLDEASEKLDVYARMEASWQEIRALAADDLGKRWFREILHGFRPALTAMRFGLYHDPFARGCELAVFLARLVDAKPDARARQQLPTALGTLHALSELLQQATPAVDPERVARDLEIPDTASLHALLAQGSRVLAEMTGLACLPRLVQLISRDRS